MYVPYLLFRFRTVVDADNLCNYSLRKSHEPECTHVLNIILSEKEVQYLKNNFEFVCVRVHARISISGNLTGSCV